MAAIPRLIPRARNEPLVVPGLALDARGVVVGDVCAVRLPRWSALVGFISLLSGEFLFGRGHLQARILVTSPTAAEIFVVLRPDGSARTSGQLSLAYDRIQALLRRLLGDQSVLTTGGGEVLVRYRDRFSPSGYDLSAIPAADPECTMMLFERDTDEPVRVEKSLAKRVRFYEDFLARLRPVASDVRDDAPRYLLTPADLVGPLTRLLRRRPMLEASVASVAVGGGADAKELALFRVARRSDRPGSLPEAWLATLGELPGTLLLDEVLVSGDADRGRAVLCAAGMRPTVWFPNVQAELPEASLLVLTSGTRRNLDLRPFPRFVALDRTVDVPDRPAERQVVTALPDPGGRARTALRLASADAPPSPPTAALLAEEEVPWLVAWAAHMPASRLEMLRVAETPGGVLVVADQGALDQVPFGRGLTGHIAGGLLLPLGVSVRPAVPDRVLRDLLGLQQDLLVVWTPDLRIDVPTSALRPLLEWLVCAPDVPRVRAEAVVPGTGAEPQLVWADEPAAGAVPEPGGPAASWWSRVARWLRGRR